ncbi:hypothetical protein DRV85_03575 [Rhodosalinus halophilus]|uniref:Lycopene cyclase domain-containing protein n=1 Tax=Rhodosalinus halophilus TaxID=2259333 RepID=A0A365UES4_9RHOB|nr:hypothetical protein [Rhodosalinus halophilus]RBI87214.1 hypothetical protein DRV85_03575 [Rhodosalinus halophilus]
MHFGLAAFLLLALALRRRRHGLRLAWLGVFALQGANEVMDAVDWIGWTGAVHWADAAGDYALTLLWPTILVLVVPRLFPGPRAPRQQ